MTAHKSALDDFIENTSKHIEEHPTLQGSNVSVNFVLELARAIQADLELANSIKEDLQAIRDDLEAIRKGNDDAN